MSGYLFLSDDPRHGERIEERIYVGGPRPAALAPRQPALRRALPSLAGGLVEAEARAVQEESLEVELHDRKVGGELNVVLSHRRDVSFSVISTQVQVDCFRRSGGDERKDSHLGSDNHWQPRATSGLIRRGPLRRRRHLLVPFVSSPEFVGQALWARIQSEAVTAFTRRSATFGMGDVKLALLLVLGLSGLATQALVLGLVLAAAFGAVRMLRYGRIAARLSLPLAPFLSGGAAVAVLL